MSVVIADFSFISPHILCTNDFFNFSFLSLLDYTSFISSDWVKLLRICVYVRHDNLIQSKCAKFFVNLTISSSKSAGVIPADCSGRWLRVKSMRFAPPAVRTTMGTVDSVLACWSDTLMGIGVSRQIPSAEALPPQIRRVMIGWVARCQACFPVERFSRGQYCRLR